EDSKNTHIVNARARLLYVRGFWPATMVFASRKFTRADSTPVGKLSRREALARSGVEPSQCRTLATGVAGRGALASSALRRSGRVKLRGSKPCRGVRRTTRRRPFHAISPAGKQRPAGV